MNNPLFAPGSALGDAFKYIFKTEANDAEVDKRFDAAMPAQAAPDNMQTCSDVA